MKTEMYRIVFSNDAKKDLKELSKKAPQAVKKLSKLLEEIQEHPRTGTGQVEPLKGYDGNIIFPSYNSRAQTCVSYL